MRDTATAEFHRKPSLRTTVVLAATVVLVGSGLLGAAAAGATVSGVPASSAVPATAPVGHTAGTSGWWVPPLGNQPWQWELSNPLNLKNATPDGHEGQAARWELGPGAGHLRHRRHHQPGVHGQPRCHAMGKHVVCYIEVGAVGNYYIGR